MSLTIDFSNSNVLVVGGTSGINLGIASGFAEHGANVAVISRSQDKVDDAVKLLQNVENAGTVRGFAADVRNAELIAQCVAELSADWGELDIVISGAAGNFPATAQDMSVNAFKSVVEIDLLGTFHVMKAIYPHIKKPGGSVINISAPQAFIPMFAQSHVCAAKAGVDMITKSLALEWSEDGIRINSVVPGPIAGTEGMARLAPDPAIQHQVAKSVPLQRLGVSADIANACLFLSSDLASYITGVVLPVDGGWSLGGARLVAEGLKKQFQHKA